LSELLDAGISVVLCTDNPGISRTTLANEFVVASRMSKGGISKWTALALIRESFSKSFAPAVIREKLLAAAEHAVLECCTRFKA
jgi:adenosine deaminase